MAKPIQQLVPSIERRLSTWLTIEENRRQQPHPGRFRPTITISRQYGCEAFPLAEKLKDIMEDQTGEPWIIYDRTLLERVSTDEKLSMILLQNLGDPSRQLDILTFMIPNSTSHNEAFRRVVRHLVYVAEEGNAIVVGRGGAILTQKLSNCFHFRLEGSFEFRVTSMARRLDLNRKDAEKLVKENEKNRERFIHDCLNTSPDDRSFYDAVYNNARHSVDDIAWSIFAYVARHWTEPSIFPRWPLLTSGAGLK